MIAYNQKDYTAHIEQSPYTLASDGCLITSLASIHTKFYPEAKMTPPKMMALLEPIIGDKSGAMVIGNLKGELAKKVGFEYATRVYKDISRDYGAHARNPEEAVIIEVDVNRFNNIKTDQHFVAVASHDESLEIMDPLGGKFRRGLPPQYLFKSYIVFNKLDQPVVKPVVSDFAKDAVAWAKVHGISKWENPQEPVTAEMVDDICAKLKLSKDEKFMTKERLVTILHRLVINQRTGISG